MAKDKLVTLANDLESVMDSIAEVESTLLPLKEKEEAIRKELCEALLKKGLAFVRTDSGLSFGIVQGRKTFLVKKGKEQEAIAWAQKEYPGLLALNKADLAKVLKPMLAVPPFFEEKVGEPHLSVRTTEN